MGADVIVKYSLVDIEVLDCPELFKATLSFLKSLLHENSELKMRFYVLLTQGYLYRNFYQKILNVIDDKKLEANSFCQFSEFHL